MNVNALKGRIVAGGYTVESFCAMMGFVRSTFDRKLNGRSEFTRDEIEQMIIRLGLTPEETRKIFFTKVVA